MVHRGLVAVGLVALLLARESRAAEPRGRVVTDADGKLAFTVLADRDDDDDDGVADGKAADLSGDAAGDVIWVLPRGGARAFERLEGDAVRLIVADRPAVAAQLRNKKLAKLGIQGVKPGKSRVLLAGLEVSLDVLELTALDKNGEPVDLARSHASISRTLPAALSDAADQDADADALRWLVSGPTGALPRWLHVSSSRPDARPLDSLGDLTLAPTACPAGAPPELECATTPSIRATSDVVDRSHPESAQHSLLAEVGGRVIVGVPDSMAALRVGGPRHTALGPIARLRARLRVRLVRVAAGGSPPVGGDEAGALAIGREEVNVASGLWGQCGIHFGFGRELDVQVVDPPPPHLLAIGCDLGMPASGGKLVFTADKQEISVQTRPGQTPTEVAQAVARAVRKAGLAARLSANSVIAPGALRSVDVLVRRADGAFVALGPAAGQPLSGDPTLDVCLGEVDLSDGLTHFTDFDAAAGTVEERSLFKAFEDGDPTTIEVFVVPSFAKSGRIGESFIYADGSSVRNAVIVDRAGIRAGARSFALAHELGHILLDVPGHPDDYGVDQPSSLMDADAADPTIFGPRRLSVVECERALRQSGPGAPVPLLQSWPLFRERK